jgi:hypothetical protein
MTFIADQIAIEDQKTNVGRLTNGRPVNRSFRFALPDIIYLSPNNVARPTNGRPENRSVRPGSHDIVNLSINSRQTCSQVKRGVATLSFSG